MRKHRNIPCFGVLDEKNRNKYSGCKKSLIFARLVLVQGGRIVLIV